MGSELASIILGIALVITGVLLLRNYYRRWNEELKNSSGVESVHPHVHSQLRRRFQVAIIVLFLGFLIPVCENLITEKNPTLYVICMSGVLLLAFWIVFLVTIDFMLIQSRAKGAMQLLDIRKKELEKQIEELRNREIPESDSTTDFQKPELN